MTVPDHSKVEAALDYFDGETHIPAEKVGPAMDLVFAAARAVLDGQDVKWCENHSLPSDPGRLEQVCAIAYMPLYEPDTDHCRMVKVRLVTLEET